MPRTLGEVVRWAGEGIPSQSSPSALTAPPKWEPGICFDIVIIALAHKHLRDIFLSSIVNNNKSIRSEGIKEIIYYKKTKRTDMDKPQSGRPENKEDIINYY